MSAVFAIRGGRAYECTGPVEQIIRLHWSARLTKPVRMSFKLTATVEADRIQGAARYLLASAEFSGTLA